MKSLDIVKQIRDRKYYDQFGYGVKFILPEVSVLRNNLNHDSIESQLDYRQNYRNINWGGSWQTLGRAITQEVRNNCHNFCDFLLSRTLPYKFAIFDTHIGHYYTDIQSEAENLVNLDYVNVLNINKASVELPRNSIRLKQSDYSYRTYFSNQHLSLEQKSNFVNFLKPKTDLRLSPSLEEYISRSRNRYITDNYFIDHNDKGFLTFLRLASAVKIKKTVDIICDK